MNFIFTNARYFSILSPATLLREEAGRSTWEEAFRLQHLSVLSGDPAVVTRRLTAAAEELRRGGEGAAFATELLTGERGGSEGILGGGTGKVRGRSRKKGAPRDVGGLVFVRVICFC